jgi:hypothetical protein
MISAWRDRALALFFLIPGATVGRRGARRSVRQGRRNRGGIGADTYLRRPCQLRPQARERRPGRIRCAGPSGFPAVPPVSLTDSPSPPKACEGARIAADERRLAAARLAAPETPCGAPCSAQRKRRRRQLLIPKNLTGKAKLRSCRSQRFGGKGARRNPSTESMPSVARSPREIEALPRLEIEQTALDQRIPRLGSLVAKNRGF